MAPFTVTFSHALFGLLSILPNALASLQSPAFKIHATGGPTSLINLPLTAYEYHPPNFYYAALSSAGTPLIGYLNGTDGDDSGTTLQFINVPGYEGASFGFLFNSAGGSTPYNPVTLFPGAGNKGVVVNNAHVFYEGPGGGYLFACSSAVNGGPTGQVFYTLYGAALPSGCSALTLTVAYD